VSADFDANADRDDPRRLHDSAHAALSRCWTQAAARPGYHREDWILIERQLHASCDGGCLVRKIYPRIG
jgi:hypothetical protein